MKILVADDHQLMREGLKPLLLRLGRHVQLVEAWDAATVWSAVRRHPDLDVALIDLNMPGMTGADSIASLRDSFPSLPIIVVSGVEDPADVEDTLRLGASGYVPKSASAEVMLSAIRLVLAGGQYLPPLLLTPKPRPAGAAVRGPSNRRLDPVARPIHLSQRQLQVVELLADGLSNKAIAQQLGLTVGTVKSHMVQIFQVLGVHNRTSAVMAAQSLRLRSKPPTTSP